MIANQNNIPDDNTHILLAKYLSGEADARETAAAEAWIKASEINKQYMETLSQICQESALLAKTGEPDVQAALHHFRTKRATMPARTFSLHRWIQAAAAVLIIASSAIFLIARDHSRNSEHTRNNNPEWKTIAASSQPITASLPDSSVVQVSPHSTLLYPAEFTGRQRTARLSGNAFFTVSRHAGNPFRVEVGDMTVTVLGTSFRITSLPDKTEIFVTEGKVEVVRGQQRQQVNPHEKLIVPQDTTRWSLETDTAAPAKWKKLPAKPAIKDTVNKKAIKATKAKVAVKASSPAKPAKAAKPVKTKKPVKPDDEAALNS